jgi:hypothetical protein
MFDMRIVSETKTKPFLVLPPFGRTMVGHVHDQPAYPGRA